MNRYAKGLPQVIAAAMFLLPTFAVHVQAQAAAGSASPTMETKFTVKVNSKSSKVGDAVEAKTLRTYKLQDGTEIPKGSKFIGKVASVQSRKQGGGDSLLTFRFDQLEVKDGATIPVHALVVAIGPEMSPHDLFGANSVMARNTNPQGGTGVTAGSQGTGSSNGIDPNSGLGSAGAKDEDDIRMGSTLQGVSLGTHMDADWTTMLKGFKSEIDIDSSIVAKVQLK